MIRSVKFKLAALISVAVVLAGAVLVGFYYYKGKTLLLTESTRRAQTVAKNLAYNSKVGVFARQADPITGLLPGVLEDPDVQYVRVVAFTDTDKPKDIEVLVSDATPLEKAGKAPDLDPLTNAAVTRILEDLPDTFAQRGGIRILDVVTPVVYEAGSADLGFGLGLDEAPAVSSNAATKIGFVQIGYSLEPAYAQAQALAVNSLGILAGIILIGVSAAWLIAHRFVSPLSTIVASSRRVAQGDLSQTITQGTEAQDELGDLIRSYNQMVLDLRRSRGEVDEYNKNLTSKVDERTKEVEQAYANLKASQEAQTAYSQVLRIFNETADVDAVLRNGLQGLLQFTGAVIGAVHVWDERDRRFHTSAAQGLSRMMLKPFLAGDGFAGRAAQERKTLFMRELPEDTAWSVRTVAGDVRPKELLAAPIIYRDDVLGVLELATIWSFDDARRRLLDDLMGQFAIALSNVIANEKTRQLAQSLQAKGRELEQQNRTLQEQSLALQRQQRELDEKNKDLQRASKMKSEFLANMSHELRTPMNSIIGYTDLVLNRAGEVLEARHRKNLEKVLSNAQHLLSLINGILDLSKIEAGKMELFLEEFDMPPLLESTAAMAEVLIKGKPVKLVQKIDTELPRIKTDKTKLRQIVLNLLSNACKFTEQGEVRLTCEQIEGRRKGDAEKLLKIQVKDSGIGIAEKDLPIIFEEFRQVDGSSTRKYGGTGLGLAIVRKMVTLMNGEISVQSELGEGSTFTVILPFNGEAMSAAADGTATTATAAVHQPSPGAIAGGLEAQRERERGDLRDMNMQAGVLVEDSEAGKKTILVVDDEPDSVILVRENLTGQPYRVLSAFTADEGMRMAIKTKPFAILLDIMMPDRDGWDLIRDLKANSETSGIPIVILSIVDNKALGFSLGVTDYLLKPVDHDALVSTLTRITIKPVKNVMVVDDDPGVREILEDMLKREGYEVELAKNGVEAIAQLGRSEPDLIILDLMMPEMDGFEVVRHMRGNVRWRDIPVVICTAKDLTAAERIELQRQVSRIVEKGAMQKDVLLADLGGALRNIEQQLAAKTAAANSDANNAGGDTNGGGTKRATG